MCAIGDRHIHIQIRIRIHTNTHTHTHTYTHTNTHTYTHTRSHSKTHTLHIHTYVCVCLSVCAQFAQQMQQRVCQAQPRQHNITVRTLGMQYGVATISRLLRITGLFCKRVLSKRLYSAKETTNFKEPTNHCHPILTSLLCVKVCEFNTNTYRCR